MSLEEGEDGVGADGWLELRASIVFAEVEEAFVGADPVSLHKAGRSDVQSDGIPGNHITRAE